MAKSSSDLSPRSALRMLGGHGSYSEIPAAIDTITTPANVAKICGAD